MLRQLAALVDAVVEVLAVELDPDSVIWPDNNALKPLRAELTEILDGAIADWRLEQKEIVEKRRAG